MENSKKTLDDLEHNFEFLGEICSGMYKMIEIDNPNHLPVQERLITYIGENASWYQRLKGEKEYVFVGNGWHKHFLRIHLKQEKDWKTFVTNKTEQWLYFLVHNWAEVNKEKDKKEMNRLLKDILVFLEENGVYECFYVDTESSMYVSTWDDGASSFDIILNASNKIYIYLCFGDS